MRITWRERLVMQPSLRDFTKWPVIPIDTIPTKFQKRFLRNQHVVAQVLSKSEKLFTIANNHNLSPGRVSQLLDRCLGGQTSAPPALTAGFIPNKNIATKQRQQALPTFDKQSGNACAFKALLQDVPQLSEKLDEMIQAKLDDKEYAQIVTPQTFHGEFKRILAEAHWPQDHYPYTCASIAYETARRYLHQRTAELKQIKTVKEKPAPPNFGIPSKLFRAMRAVQIDEQVMDLNCQLHLLLNDELIPLRMSRVNVLAATDVDTTSIMGFHLALTRHPNQQDLLTLVDNCIQPWQPLELTTPGLSYVPGANFPSGLDFPISFGTVQLDNALMHSAHSIIDLLCENWGATVSYGHPGVPTTRHVIESAFDYINKMASHRVASTTGSYPTDPKKESRKNQKKIPVITFQTLIEILSIILTEYNITPKASLGNASPLELFEYQCHEHFVRFVPPFLSQHFHPFNSSKEVVLHWNQKDSRLPHVNFMYQRYQGPSLIHAVAKEKRIRVEFDRRDIRTLHAYTLSGDSLGDLHVSKPWQRFPHSLATRQWIHTHNKQYRFNARDPLSDYFRILLENKGKPKMAQSLMRVYNEFTFDQPNVLTLGETELVSIDTASSSSKTTKQIWHTGFANHRK